MFFVVTLRLKNNRLKNVYIPAHWCMGIDMQRVYDGGILRTDDLKVFYSKCKTRLPNFELPIRDEFVEEDACYVARYRKCESEIDIF